MNYSDNELIDMLMNDFDSVYNLLKIAKVSKNNKLKDNIIHHKEFNELFLSAIDIIIEGDGFYDEDSDRIKYRVNLTELVELMLECGADPNIADENGKPLLWKVIRNGDISIVKSLLDHGANPNIICENGKTLLWKVIEERGFDTREIILLLNHGAYVNIRYNDKLLICKAIECKVDINVFERMIECGANVRNKDVINLLFKIIRKNYDYCEDYTKILLDHGIDVNIKNENGNTLLHLVSNSCNDCKSFVKLLLERGADANAKNDTGDTPLYLACKNGYSGCVKLIIKKSKCSIKNGTEDTPLHLACKYGHHKVVDILLHSCSLNINELNWYKETPLCLACICGNIEIVKSLLKYGANINIGFPLHEASKKGHIEVVKLLLKHGADVNTKDKDNQTAKDLAKRWNHNNVVELIEKYEKNSIDLSDVGDLSETNDIDPNDLSDCE